MAPPRYAGWPPAVAPGSCWQRIHRAGPHADQPLRQRRLGIPAGDHWWLPVLVAAAGRTRRGTPGWNRPARLRRRGLPKSRASGEETPSLRLGPGETRKAGEPAPGPPPGRGCQGAGEINQGIAPGPGPKRAWSGHFLSFTSFELLIQPQQARTSQPAWGGRTGGKRAERGQQQTFDDLAGPRGPYGPWTEGSIGPPAPGSENTAQDFWKLQGFASALERKRARSWLAA